MATPAAFNRRDLFHRWHPQPEPPASRPLSARRQELVVARRAMACDFSLSFPAGCPNAVDAACAALDEVERLEARLSVYRPESDLSYLNAHAADSPVRTSAEVHDLLAWAIRLSRDTAGAFDATTGALIKAWGFFHGPRRVPSDTERRLALAASGVQHVHFDDAERTISFARPGIEFNLGGIGKGFAIDRALHIVARDFGIRSALMQGGQSSLRGIGAPAGEPRGWPVAIGDPLADPATGGRPLAVIRLRDRALGTSGSANQFFLHEGRRYGHILDPRTGWPARGVYSASAVAPTATEADALSTAFYVMGFDAARQYCRQHPIVGAVMVVPGPKGSQPRVRITGAVEAEVRI